MIKHTILCSVAAAVMSFAGSTVQAAFTYSTSSTTSVISGTNSNSSITVTDIGTTTTSTLAATPNVFVRVSNNPTTDFTFRLTTTYTVNGVAAATLTTDFTVPASGLLFGTYQAGAQTLTVLSTAPAGFTFSTPKATDGDVDGTNGSTSLRIIQTAAVPEPASLAMVGLGLAGVGGLAFRRRRVA